MDQKVLIDTVLQRLGKNYRYIGNRWWVLIDNRWRQEGAHGRLRLSIQAMVHDLWPGEKELPDYRVDRLVRQLTEYLTTLGLPGRPEHTPETETFLGISSED